MFHVATLSDYFRALHKQIAGDIEATPDDQVLGMEFEAWVDYLVAKYTMEPIELDTTRETGLEEVEVEYTSRGYDIYTDRAGGSAMRATCVKVSVPVVPSETLREIWKHELAPNTFSLVRYPEYQYDESRRDHLDGR